MPTLDSIHVAACSGQSSLEAACLSWKSAAAASARSRRVCLAMRMLLELPERSVQGRTCRKLVAQCH